MFLLTTLIKSITAPPLHYPTGCIIISSFHSQTGMQYLVICLQWLTEMHSGTFILEMYRLMHHSALLLRRPPFGCLSFFMQSSERFIEALTQECVHETHADFHSACLVTTNDCFTGPFELNVNPRDKPNCMISSCNFNSVWKSVWNAQNNVKF